MDDSTVVRVLHGVRELDHQFHAIVDRELVRADVVGDRRSRDQLHDKMRRRVAIACRERVDLSNAGVLQAAEHLGLLLEAAEDLGMMETAPQDLDRDRTARPILLGGVDDTHAARSQRVEHEEVPEPGAGLQGAVNRGHIQRRDALGIEEVGVGRVEGGQKRLDFAAQPRVAATPIVEYRGPIARIDVRERKEDRLGRGQRHGWPFEPGPADPSAR